MPAAAFAAIAPFAVVFGGENHQTLLVEVKINIFNEPLGRFGNRLVHTGLAVMDAARGDACWQ